MTMNNEQQFDFYWKEIFTGLAYNPIEFNTYRFDQTMSLPGKVNKLYDMFKVLAMNNQEVMDYLKEFVETFDRKLYETIDDILSKWLEDGILTELIRNAINEEVVEARNAYSTLKERLDSEKADVNTQLSQTNTQLTQTDKDLTSRGLNVLNFGAVGDGITDDTLAIQACFDKASELLKVNTVSTGVSIGMIPTIIFPDNGHFIISDRIIANAYCKIKSGGGVLIEQVTEGKDIFDVSNAFNVNIFGINFLKGRNAIRLTNANVNQSIFNIENCSFQLQESYSIYTKSTSATWTNMSANLRIIKSHFRNTNKMLYNVCDSVLIRECWVQIRNTNFEPDTAYIYNQQGRLFLDHFFSVPEQMNTVPNARWIDTFDDVTCTNCRFGGENGGMPIVYFLDGREWETSPNRVPKALVFKDSWLYCGVDSNPLEGVIHPINSIPGYIKVQGCELVGHLINNSNNIDFSTYFTNDDKADIRRYRFDIDENLIGVGGGTTMPDELLYFTRLKTRPSADIPNGIELGDNRKFALVDGDVIGGIGFSGLDTTSGASGTRAKFYAEIKGTAGQTDLVFETSLNNAQPREVLRITHDGKLFLNGVEITTT